MASPHPGAMPEAEPLDYDKLEHYLRALAYSSRLELLHHLRLPLALPDIRLQPRQSRPGENPDRSMSRQAIQDHLEKLLEIGVVVAREPEKGKRGREYMVNPQRVYQITEEFRKISTITVGAPASRDATVVLGDTRAGELEPGPKLVLVHGLLEGKAYPLRRTDLHGERGWIIGRKPGLHVSLEYDPYVSLENSEIIPQANEYLLTDLRSSRNGTWLNWRRLDNDERAPLHSGDVVGVGRSLLVCRRE